MKTNRSRMSAALGLVVALASGPAIAQTIPSLNIPAPRAGAPARLDKPQAEVEAAPSSVTRPAPPLRHTDRSDGPLLTAGQFVEQREKQLIEIVDQQITKMARLLRATPDDDPLKPDLQFRLGELYAEKQRFHFQEARRLDQAIFDARAGGKDALLAEQASHEKEEQRWRLEAAKSYVAASRFKRYARMDEVLFRLAYLLTSAKREEQAREYFHRLIRDYPNSRYVPDAYLSFAEYFFERGEMEHALELYGKVAQFPKSSVYGFAVYKQAWCHVNLGDFKRALEIFVEVATRIAPAQGKRGEALAREARRDIVKAYAEVGGPDKAWEFFRRTGGDLAPKMIESLAELYWEHGKFADSSRTYHRIIASNPDSPQICGWQLKIVRNTLSDGGKRDQAQEIERLGAVYDHLCAAKTVAKALLSECRSSTHDMIRELALVWHREAIQTKNRPTFELALLLYRAYLGRFADQKPAYDMSFYCAELLFELGRWREAAEQYTKVVEMNPGGRHTREAAYAAVVSWQNALPDDDHPAPHTTRI